MFIYKEENMTHNRKKSTNRNRHKNHRDDKTSWHEGQNCYKCTPNTREDRGKYEYAEESNRRYKKDIKFLKI